MTDLLTPLGRMRFRPVNPGEVPQERASAALDTTDIPLLHRWITHPKARFWGQQESSVDDIHREYVRMAATPHESAWILEWLRPDAAGPETWTSTALVEVYDPTHILPRGLVAPQDSDRGMHILVPATDGPTVSGLTDTVMAVVMRWLIAHWGARRILVEPDATNTAIHAKNAAAGFRDIPGLESVDLGWKHARIQYCTPRLFAASRLASRALSDDPVPAASHLASHGAAASRLLVAKALREWVHERLVTAEDLGPLDDTSGSTASTGPTSSTGFSAPRRYRISPDDLGGITAEFTGRPHALEHLSIDPVSIMLRDAETGEPVECDVVDLTASAADTLGIPDHFVATYLEELAATVAGRARTLAEPRPRAAELVARPGEGGGRAGVERFQRIEGAMVEGHPGFVANAGRGGMGESHNRAFAPELGAAQRIVWLAARRADCVTPAAFGIDWEEFVTEQMGPSLRRAYEERLAAAGLTEADYVPLPVHEWQWEQRVTTTFAADLAAHRLLFVGVGDELYRPQQSLRTLFNLSRPDAPYVKLAAAVRNMGFLRGLSPAYMSVTPAINEWLAGELDGDAELKAAHVRLLAEHVAVGYTGDAYHRAAKGHDGRRGAHEKMLAALWRRSPVPMLREGHEAATLAGIFYVDAEGTPLVAEWIRASGGDAAAWVDALWRIYVRPLVHCLLSRDLAFMPHSENVILELRDGVPVGMFLKDLGEEVAILSATRPLPEEVERVRQDHGSMDDEERALALHTDILDGVLRHLAALLDDHGLLPEERFWELGRQMLADYDADHPELAGRLPLTAPDFRHSCLNRLQLRNPMSMVDLANQSESLAYAGRLANPLAQRPAGTVSAEDHGDAAQ